MSNAPGSPSSHDGLRIEPVYLVRSGDMMIEAPVKSTWVHVVNYPSWQHYPIVRHISGKPGQEGEVVLLKKEEKGFEFPPYYARTLKIDLERRLMWKTFPQNRQPIDFFGIVDFQLQPAADGTRFVYDVLYEFLVPYQDERELDAFRQAQYDNFEPLFGSVLPKLKRLAEQGR